MDTITLAFIGVLVSLVISYIKGKFSIQGNAVLLIVAGLSLLGAFAYSVLVHFGYWTAVLGILTYAGAFYAFVIKTVQNNK